MFWSTHAGSEIASSYGVFHSTACAAGALACFGGVPGLSRICFANVLVVLDVPRRCFGGALVVSLSPCCVLVVRGDVPGVLFACLGGASGGFVDLWFCPAASRCSWCYWWRFAGGVRVFVPTVPRCCLGLKVHSPTQASKQCAALWAFGNDKASPDPGSSLAKFRPPACESPSPRIA